MELLVQEGDDVSAADVPVLGGHGVVEDCVTAVSEIERQTIDVHRLGTLDDLSAGGASSPRLGCSHSSIRRAFCSHDRSPSALALSTTSSPFRLGPES